MERNVASIFVSVATAAACLRVREAHWLDLRHLSSGTKVEVSISSSEEVEFEEALAVSFGSSLPSSPPLPSSPSPWPRVPFFFSSSFFSRGRAIAGCHLFVSVLERKRERERKESELFCSRFFPFGPPENEKMKKNGKT